MQLLFFQCACLKFYSPSLHRPPVPTNVHASLPPLPLPLPSIVGHHMVPPLCRACPHHWLALALLSQRHLHHHQLLLLSHHLCAEPMLLLLSPILRQTCSLLASRCHSLTYSGMTVVMCKGLSTLQGSGVRVRRVRVRVRIFWPSTNPWLLSRVRGFPGVFQGFHFSKIKVQIEFKQCWIGEIFIQRGLTTFATLSIV